MDYVIRTASTTDAAGVLEIYAPVVLSTAISFETEVPNLEEMKQRIESYRASHAYLVAEADNQILGYAYGSTFRPRAAYHRTAEVTVYVHPEHTGTGIGRSLYGRLFKVLNERGMHLALGGICLPNDASIALHKSCGFKSVGTFREVGFKFGKWHDVEWWQKPLTQIH